MSCSHFVVLIEQCFCCMGFSQLSLSSILPRLQSLLRGERKQEKYPSVYCQVVYYSTNLYKNSNLRTVSNEGPAEEARIVDSCRLSSFVVVCRGGHHT